MELSHDELVVLSNHLNASANLPVEVVAIAEKLKAVVSPVQEENSADLAAPIAEVPVSEEAPAPTE